MLQNFLENHLGLARIMLYFLGLLFVAGVLGFNFAYSDKQSFSSADSLGNSWPLFAATTFQKVSEVEVMIRLKKPQPLDNVRAQMTRSFTVLAKNRNSMITEAEDLKKAIFTLPDAPFPDGAIVTYKKSYFFSENGMLRPIPDYLFSQVGWNKSQAREIDRETFDKIEKDSPLDFENFNDYQNFPRGMAFETKNGLFINGSKRLFPVFSQSLLEKSWPNFPIIKTNGLVENEMQYLDCFSLENNSVLCKGSADKLNKNNGNAYLAAVYGVSLDNIDRVEFSLKKGRDIKELGAYLKNLFW